MADTGGTGISASCLHVKDEAVVIHTGLDAVGSVKSMK